MSTAKQAVICGVYVTEQAKSLPGRTSLDLIFQAVQGALEDAGLKPSDVDGVAVDWPGPGGAPNDTAANWAPYFQSPLAWTNNHILDTAGVRGVLKAAAAVQAGHCETVVIGSGRAGAFSADGSAVGTGLGLEFLDCYGASVMAQFALVLQRYLYENQNASLDQLAHVAAVIRNHGHLNIEAAMYGRGPYTAEDILNSPMVASPLTRLMCCLIQEGASALVVTTLERARDLKQRPIVILGGGQEMLRGNYTAPPIYKEVKLLGQRAAHRMFGMAGVSRDDVDVFSLYDAVAFEVISQLEMLGYCEQGDGGAFCAGDRLTLTGTHPTNLDGGLLSHSWTGTSQLTNKVIEGVRQLRHSCGTRQVNDAEIALISNAGSGAHHIELMLLGRG